jgi:hypothetical protein
MNFLFTTNFSVIFRLNPLPKYGTVRKIAKEHGLSIDDNEKLAPLFLDYMFSEDRMGYKFLSFEHLTLPSVVQSLTPFPNSKWIIYISKEMPLNYQERLYSLTNPYPQIEVTLLHKPVHDRPIHWKSEIDKMTSNNERFCTIRCDDDDKLPENLTLNIYDTAKTKSQPFIYSSDKGYACYMKPSGEVVLGKRLTIGKNGTKGVDVWGLPTQGLAYVDGDVTLLGNHTTIEDRFPSLDIVRNCSDHYLSNHHSDFCTSSKAFK